MVLNNTYSKNCGNESLIYYDSENLGQRTEGSVGVKYLAKIGVVLVTHNRIDMLIDALKCYDSQTRLPDYILIVNNASCDGTLEYLENWKSIQTKYEKKVINLDTNLGGSGGFYEGLMAAEKLKADWIWVADDDAFPQRDALEEAEKYIYINKDKLNGISSICGMVINEGRIDTFHRRWIKQYGIIIIDKKIPSRMYRKCFELNAFSYVGTIINRKMLSEVGFPEKDYFIRFDDTEHSLRLSKKGKIICVPSIKIYHNVKESNSIIWKSYYNWRNITHMYKKHFPRLCYLLFYYSVLVLSYIEIVLKIEIPINKIRIEALKDADNNKLGVHNEYHP